MSTFSQSEIDASSLNIVLLNNPDGGNGADYTASCIILEDKNNIGHPLLWQSGDDETAEGFEKHQIGVTYAPDERFSYIICTEKTNYPLFPTTFSEVSDEIVIHRVFCAALRPTNTDFTFSNPIKNITVSASADTVNLQVIALDEYKTVTARNPIIVTHAQDFPCVFGIVYKHKNKGDITLSAPTEKPVHRYSISFSAHNEINYCQKMFDAGDAGIKIEKVTLNTLEEDIQCQRLVFRQAGGNDYDIVDSDNGLTIGDNYTLNSLLVNSGFLGEIYGKVTCELTVPECPHDVVLTIYYTEIENDD